MNQQSDNLICNVCQKSYSSVSAKNRHLRTVHHEAVEETAKNTVHIQCPICNEQEKPSFGSHDLLISHLENNHSLSIKTSFYNFRTMEEFETWRALISRSVDYVVNSTHITQSTNTKLIYYNCNRSNYRGFVSQCNQRSMKKGGSIRISGMCPSRICVKICGSEITVKFIETHVGHGDDLRAKHLTQSEQQEIAKKLIDGVTKERILQDSRAISDHQIERKNLLHCGDLAYIIRKFNIDKKRHDNDMIATALKVKEWNDLEENSVFLFKQLGENYPGLQMEDFALAFMNKNMERKLKEFRKIICIDGTHGTNTRNWDLTVVLVKDENNIGFPVSFLISNRLDQAVQKIFFSSLRTRIGEDIDADYIMTDDDIKYYNAWCQAMGSVTKPRRLLCSWHVIKNWNIQGRNKLKNPEIKKQMKYRMRKILRETDWTTFLKLKEDYFKDLEKEGENEFLKYLMKLSLFQTEERIKMWSYCHRVNAGINTNMAIESLNKVLKHNKMRGNQNIRIEKLLDLLEELVNDKMWKKIIETERPTANSYQSRTNREAHLKAENEVLDKVVCLESGDFKVPSSSSDREYIVSYNVQCDEDCRRLFCYKCQVCIHRFKCQCTEYTVKTALCKHIHAVALVEKGSDSVVGNEIEEEEEEDSNLCISEPSTSRTRYEDDVQNFIAENEERQNPNVSTDQSRKQAISKERAKMLVDMLNDDNLDKILRILEKAVNNRLKVHQPVKRGKLISNRIIPARSSGVDTYKG